MVKDPKSFVVEFLRYGTTKNDLRTKEQLFAAKIFLAWDYPQLCRRGLIEAIDGADEQTRRSIIEWLNFVDRGRGSSGVQAYAPALSTNGEKLSLHLLNHVYTLHAGDAMLVIEEVERTGAYSGIKSRELAWSDHLVTTIAWRQRNNFLQPGDLDAVQKELDKLSKHEGWYARRYVVQILSVDPKLGTPEILDRLKKDKHSLVSEAAKLIK